jgi:hypothetical protein
MCKDVDDWILSFLIDIGTSGYINRSSFPQLSSCLDPPNQIEGDPSQLMASMAEGIYSYVLRYGSPELMKGLF